MKISLAKNKIFTTSGPLDAHHGSCTTYVVGGPLMDHLWQIYKQAIYKVPNKLVNINDINLCLVKENTHFISFFQELLHQWA